MSFDNKKTPPKAILVSIPLPENTDSESRDSLSELERLVTTLGYSVVGTLSQRRKALSKGTVLGAGKLKELAKFTGGTGVVASQAPQRKTKAAERFALENAEDEIEEEIEEFESETDEPKEQADCVIFDCDLTPSQLVNVESATGVDVLDRTGVIVEIFSRHAKTREARLQVEIARLKYMAPRVRETGGDSGDRMGGTSGETALELDKRKIRDRIALLKSELDAVQKEQSTRRTTRSDHPCVALVGYTNAGKSSLMRALTGSEVLVEDKLFATLDTTVRVMQPVTSPKVLVSDTVGFIKKLPHDLVASFRSTLEEAKNASLLLFVVDSSDASFRAQLQVTKDVLAEIGVDDVPSKLVLNKRDRLSEQDKVLLRKEFPDAVMLSAKNAKDIVSLKDEILKFFEQDSTEEELHIPYTVQGIIGEIRANARVLKERYDENGVFLLLRASPEKLNAFKKKLELNQ